MTRARSRALPVLLAAACAAFALTAPTPATATSPASDEACPWMDAGQTPEARAAELLPRMGLDDKIQLVTGIGLFNPASPSIGASGAIPGNPRLCIPDLVLNDSSGGIGFQQSGTTAFPQGITQASTWNRDLIKTYGGVLADEAMRKGVNVVLGPGLNIARNPLLGRNLEYAGEDPYLTGQLGVSLIRGLQSRPVVATAKHYLLNEQEKDRMTNSSEVDDRTLHEIYLAPFEDAVAAGVGAVMCSYNRVDSVYACENKRLLQDLLKDELGFDGFVMSDWWATHSTAPTANAGMDMEMPGDGYVGIAQASPAKYGAALKAAVQDGSVPQARLDDMIRRITTVMFRHGLFEHPPVAQPTATDATSLATARDIAEQGSVLLKNDPRDGTATLPIPADAKRIAVIGTPATGVGAQIASQGFGSNHVPVFGLHQVTLPLAAIRDRAEQDGTRVSYDTGLIPALSALSARTADVAVVFVNDSNVEGQDRPDLRPHQALCNPLLAVLKVSTQCLPIPTQQDALVAAVAKANPHTVVVLQNGGPLAMPWLDSVASVVENWYPGQVDGDAVASLLFGDSNFSGKLPVTFPKSLDDDPLQSDSQYPGVEDAEGIPHSTYSEGLQVGYRWYQQQGIEPLFPFGYGLSYTSFAFSGLAVQPTDEGARATFTVTNTGDRAGAEVAQLYVGFPDAAGEPPLQLKGFEKVHLEPGESRTVTLDLDARAFQVWDDGWTTVPGCYAVRVGDSSAHLPLAGQVGRGGSAC